MSRFFWKRFIGIWLIAFLTLQLSRLVFLLNLKSYFQAPFAEILDAFLFGFQFDAVSIAYLIGPFLLAVPFLVKGWSETLVKWLILIMLGAINLLNCIDAEFFRFTARRSTDDLFAFAFLSDDIFHLAPNLITDFWYLLLFFFAVMFLALWLMNRLFSLGTEQSKTWQKWLSLIPIVAILIFAARGGTRPIPLTIIDAGNTTNPQLNAIALNTSFTILKTIGKPELPRFEFETSEISDSSPIIYPAKTSFSGKMKGHNVVVIIVESLSTEYIHALNGLELGYTPFVDSLCSISMVFENGYANGHRSIEGIPAVVSGIPTLMYEPYSTSRYAGNNVTSLANVLGGIGYHSSFMHGGNKNSMNFEAFARQAGYDLFYNRYDYPFPDEHYDGFWGISDHYFLNQCVNEYDKFQKPFFSSIFTLSSHHPYSLPAEYQNRFPKGTLPIHESLGYTDEALRQFFKKASHTDWYKNTLFVITADHTSLSEHQQFQTKIGSLRIPIILFQPNDSTFVGRQSTTIQQIDIMPTVLGLLGYDKPFFSLGVDAFNESAIHGAVAFKHDQYQMLIHDTLICFDGNNVTFVYDVANDPKLKHDLKQKNFPLINRNLNYLRSSLQNYSVALNENRMTVESWEREK